jgi:hypothetical protein
MRRRKDGRDMAAVLDKARELSRNEPSADWSDAEWRELMAAAVSQKLERKAGRAGSGRGPVSWKPVLAYGTLAIIMIAVTGLILKNTIFKSAVGPSAQAPALVEKLVAPPLPAIQAPPSEMPSVIAQAPRTVAPKPARPVTRPRPLAAPREEASQDTVTVKLVSPDSGLQIVWVLNKNFDWKGENK